MEDPLGIVADEVVPHVEGEPGSRRGEVIQVQTEDSVEGKAGLDLPNQGFHLLR